MPKNGGRGGRGGRGEDDRTNKIQNIRFNAIREKRRKDKHINTQRKIGVSVAYGQSCVYISRKKITLFIVCLFIFVVFITLYGYIIYFIDTGTHSHTVHSPHIFLLSKNIPTIRNTKHILIWYILFCILTKIFTLTSLLSISIHHQSSLFRTTSFHLVLIIASYHS